MDIVYQQKVKTFQHAEVELKLYRHINRFTNSISFRLEIVSDETVIGIPIDDVFRNQLKFELTHNSLADAVINKLEDLTYANDEEICTYEACEIPRFKIIEGQMNPVLTETNEEVDPTVSTWLTNVGQYTDTQHQEWLKKYA